MGLDRDGWLSEKDLIDVSLGLATARIEALKKRVRAWRIIGMVASAIAVVSLLVALWGVLA